MIMGVNLQIKVEGLLQSLLSTPLPLEVGPLNLTTGSRGALLAPPAGPGAKLNLEHFSLKISHLVATILIFFIRIKRLILMKLLQSLIQKNVYPRKVGGHAPLSTHGSTPMMMIKAIYSFVVMLRMKMNTTDNHTQ